MSGIALYPPTLIDLNSDYRARRYGESYLTAFAATAGGVVAAFLPGANVSGAILRSFSITNNTSNWFTLYSDTAAPAAYNDTTKRPIIVGGVGPGYQTEPGDIFPGLFIPAARGLWLATVAGPQWGYSITWDFLP